MLESQIVFVFLQILINDVMASLTFALSLSDAVLMNHCLLGRMMTGCFVLQSYG